MRAVSIKELQYAQSILARVEKYGIMDGVKNPKGDANPQVVHLIDEKGRLRIKKV